MASTVRPHAAALVDEFDNVVADVLCVGCGASLQGQGVNAQCPRCAHPISDSVYGDYLVDSDRTRIRPLAEGARMIRYAFTMLLALLAMALFGTIFNQWRTPEHVVIEGYKLFRAFGGLSIVPAAVGMFLLTSRRSLPYWMAYYRRRAQHVMFVVKVAATFLLVLAALIWAQQKFGLVALQIVAIPACATPLVAFFRGVEGLMRRLPNRQLADLSWLMWFAAVAFAAIDLLLVVLARVIPHDSELYTLILVFTTINFVLGFVIGISVYRLTTLVERELTRVASR